VATDDEQGRQADEDREATPGGVAHEEPSPPHPGMKTRTKAGLLAATAVVALGAVGAGVAVASGGATTSAGTSHSNTSAFSQPRGYGFPNQQGMTPPGSFGGNGLPSGPGNGTDSSNTTDASAAASVGMVEITSVLSNGEAAGTGMILTSGGEVVTNHHVVEGATSINVTVVSTGASYQARYVGGDATKDVAVLQLVGASGLDTVNLDTTGTSVGAQATSVGDANGDGGSLTAAPGTVTAENQAIDVQGDDGSTHHLTGLIEVNADLMPGDSGGALLDSAGDVVGMNVAASSGNANVTGYAIPITTVTSVADAIEAGQSSSTITLGYDGYLGVGLAQGSGATVGTVADGSAAAGAGVQPGDTITSVDGTGVSTANSLRRAITTHAPGDHVQIGWTTAAGAHRSADVTLGTAPIA
jgi:S1-C subfamily serine protease